MTIKPSMNLSQPAELIGNYATDVDAATMRDYLIGAGYENMDTDMICDGDWNFIVIAAIGA